MSEGEETAQRIAIQVDRVSRFRGGGVITVGEGATQMRLNGATATFVFVRIPE
jgi:hypothetical protein